MILGVSKRASQVAINFGRRSRSKSLLRFSRLSPSVSVFSPSKPETVLTSIYTGPVTCSMTELEMLALEDDDDGR